MAILAGSVSVAHAQDRVVLRTNQVFAGKVKGMSGDKVVVAIPGGEQSFPLSAVNRVEMAEPPALATGRAALRAGDAAKAIASLRPVVDQFKGLPTPWAEEATSMLGEAYIGAKDLAKAEAAFAEFRKLYPTGRGSVRADLGLASLDVSKNNMAGARKRLEPLADAALKAKSVTAQDGAIYGQTFLLLGRVLEAEKRYPEALESYLRTVTLFHHDPSAAEEAQKRADALRKARTVSVP